MKMPMFASEKNLYIFHGRVFVMYKYITFIYSFMYRIEHQVVIHMHRRYFVILVSITRLYLSITLQCFGNTSFVCDFSICHIVVLYVFIMFCF